MKGKLREPKPRVNGDFSYGSNFLAFRVLYKAIRAADAKEVGVGNPAEETYRYPNQNIRSLT